MAESGSDDLQGVLREQEELRQRLIALDRKIEELRSPKIDLPPPLPTLVKEKPSVLAEAAANRSSETFGTHEPDQTNVSTNVVPKSSWEFQLGTVWLVRIGIVVLLTGLVFLGNFAYRHLVYLLGPFVKVAFLYLLGGGLVWIGTRLEKGAEALRNYGRVLLAGGAALVYYTTYGMSFVERLRVIESPLVGGVLLLVVGGMVLRLAEKRQMQSVALMAILLSYYSAAINPLGWFSLYSSLLLTAAAVWVLLKHRWTKVSFLSLAGTYGSFLFWQMNRSGGSPVAFWPAAAFLFCYWLLFTAAVFLSRSERFPPSERTPFLTINNGAFYALAWQLIHASHPGWDGRFSLGFGAILLVLAAVARRRESGDLFLDGVYLTQGLGVITFGLLTELHGYQLAVALAIEGTMMLFAINRRHGWIYEVGAAVVTLLGFLTGWTRGLSLQHEQSVWWTLLGIFVADAWLERHWKKRTTPVAVSWPAVGYSALAVFQLILIFSKYRPAGGREMDYCLATLALLGLGGLLKLRELAVAGQFLTVLVSGLYLIYQPGGGHPAATHFAAIALPLVLVHWWQWQRVEIGYYDWRKGGQWIFTLLFLGVAGRWIFDHAAGARLSFYLAAFALGVMLHGRWTGIRILSLGGLAALWGSVAVFFLHAVTQPPTFSWLAAGAVAIYLITERLIRHDFVPAFFRGTVRRGLILAGTLGVWLEWNRWIGFSGSHFPKTLAWAAIGTGALCIGLALRERTYRLCGLGLLALSVLRIFLNDIWGLDPIFRILSFTGLGIALLGLGFIYNKFADKLREWL